MNKSTMDTFIAQIKAMEAQCYTLACQLENLRKDIERGKTHIVE